MSALLAFAFKGNISEQVLSKLHISDSLYLHSTTESIALFLRKIQTIQSRFILGLGMYSGRDRDKLRMETICSNRFRNSILGNTVKYWKINYFLKPNADVKPASGIGNSYCNYISFQIGTLIQKQNLDLHYTFIHIPKNFDKEKAITTLRHLLKPESLSLPLYE